MNDRVKMNSRISRIVTKDWIKRKNKQYGTDSRQFHKVSKIIPENVEGSIKQYLEAEVFLLVLKFWTNNLDRNKPEL